MGSSLKHGIWCHSEAQMILHVPMPHIPIGFVSACTATFRNNYFNTASNGFVGLRKNGQQIMHALANSEASITFDYVRGDKIELWEGFAIIQAKDNWLECGAMRNIAKEKAKAAAGST